MARQAFRRHDKDDRRPKQKGRVDPTAENMRFLRSPEEVAKDEERERLAGIPFPHIAAEKAARQAKRARWWRGPDGKANGLTKKPEGVETWG